MVRGRSDYVRPPNKPDGDRADSMVDNVMDPKAIVICTDHHAYPEFLVTFKD